MDKQEQEILRTFIQERDSFKSHMEQAIQNMKRAELRALMSTPYTPVIYWKVGGAIDSEPAKKDFHTLRQCNKDKDLLAELPEMRRN